MKGYNASIRFNGMQRIAECSVTCNQKHTKTCCREQQPKQHFGSVISHGDVRSLATPDTLVDLFNPCSIGRAATVTLPTYVESIQDVPPDYTTTNALATAYTTNVGIEANTCDLGCQKFDLGVGNLHVEVDFSDVEGIRSHANKKAKKAAKEAQQAKWADSDGEGNNDGAAEGGEDPNGNAGGDGGAGAGGDGGTPPGGGDGGDDDWWNEGKYTKCFAASLRSQEQRRKHLVQTNPEMHS